MDCKDYIGCSDSMDSKDCNHCSCRLKPGSRSCSPERKFGYLNRMLGYSDKCMIEGDRCCKQSMNCNWFDQQ